MAINPAMLKVASKLITSSIGSEKVRQVILIACLIPFVLILVVLSSPFAIFFAIIGGDKYADSVSVYDTVYELSETFKSNIITEESDPNVDEINTIIMGSEDNGFIDNTTDVLIAFAVKYNVLNEKSEQIAVLDEKQVKKLKKVYNDMNSITTDVKSVSEEIEYTSTDEDGNTTTETKIITKQIKSIYVDSLTVDEIMNQYKFSKKQIEMVREMQKSEFGMLFSSNVTTFLTNRQIEEIREYMPDDLIINRDLIVEKSESLVGKVNYFWGGKSSALDWDNRWGTQVEVTSVGSLSTGQIKSFGLDCSGYVTWVFINMGLNVESINETIGHGTTNQWNLSTSINASSILKGDLAFLAGPGTRKVNHVGIVVGKDGDGSILVAHCSSGPNNIVITKAEDTGFIYFRRPAVLIE